MAVEIAAHAHPCRICRFLDDRRNSSVLASIVLYNPNCLIRDPLDVTDPSLDMLPTHHYQYNGLFVCTRASAASALENVANSARGVSRSPTAVADLQQHGLPRQGLCTCTLAAAAGQAPEAADAGVARRRPPARSAARLTRLWTSPVQGNAHFFSHFFKITSIRFRHVD
ncbi:unnamed protein product [Chrysodeixis includens]|uniref:Uncharacterized protein n=1 Tax=Chrysodeixis includens TaxID=689277 RepID=A0A9N8KRR8_CHRIL|nr:unnamed protein product [Chrysodeixis includens]